VETLAERIARDGPVSELDAIGWAIRLAKRLEGLHALGVAHGSVSPACILAAGQDRNARAYLADVQRTTPTLAYQSPERILGGDISGADDVWALAATLYALLTGQSPYAGGNDAEIRQKILAATPPPLAVYDIGDDDLQHILDHAFAREIGRRTAGITALRRALEEWHPDRGVANLPPLEDEEPTDDDDDGGRTMYMQPSVVVPSPVGPSPVGPSPKIEQDEDDEDNVRTMMRSMPKDDLAAIVARASAIADARAAAQAPAPLAPRPGAAVRAPAPVASAPARPAAALLAQPSAPAPFGGRPAPAPSIVDDDSEEDDVRTTMRTPEQRMNEDSADDAPRTILLREGQERWRAPVQNPLPAAGQPAPPPGPSAASWGDGGPSPAATLALPSYFEPASPGYAPPGQRPQLSGPGAHPLGAPYPYGPQGSQQVPPGFGYDPRPQNPALATLPLDMPPMNVGGAPRGPYPGGVQQPYGTASAGHDGGRPPKPPGPAGHDRFPVPAPARGAGGKSSKNGLILAAVIALFLAAAATFAFLKLKGL
jgi:hypothetical protein